MILYTPSLHGMAWQDYRTPAVIAAGALLRLLLFSRSDLVEYLGSRLELSTPVTSWKSRELGLIVKRHGHSFAVLCNPSDSPPLCAPVQEGIYLFQQGQDPYQGSIYRQVSIEGKQTSAKEDG